jgi:hypothetical protein
MGTTSDTGEALMPEGEKTQMFSPQLRTTYVMAGPLRWVEDDGRRAVLRVDAAGGRARKVLWAQRDARARPLPARGAMDPDRDDGLGLQPGQVVTVRARLPRNLDDLPAVLCPRSVLSLGTLH